MATNTTPHGDRNTLGPQFPPAFHRPWLRYVDPVEGAENTPPAEPQETDWKAESRKWEDRAKENLKRANANEDAARRLAEIEESNKTETQKLQEERDRAQQELASERTARLRVEVAAEKGVPAALLSGSTREELEASATALVEFRGEKPADVPTPEPTPAPKTYIVPEEGGLPNLGAHNTPTPGIGTLRAAYANNERQ